MATYFTSDLHIGHRLVAGLRGFGEDVEAHDYVVVKAFAHLHPDDIVYILGDVSISVSGWKKALPLIKKHCPGRLRLISGNHDPVSSHHRDSWKYQKEALEVFESVQEYGRIKFAGGYALLSHYPYSGVGSDRGEERYTQYRLPDLGLPLIHGHTHGTEKVHYSERGTLEIHVGMDAWGMELVPMGVLEKLAFSERLKDVSE